LVIGFLVGFIVVYALWKKLHRAGGAQHFVVEFCAYPQVFCGGMESDILFSAFTHCSHIDILSL